VNRNTLKANFYKLLLEEHKIISRNKRDGLITIKKLKKQFHIYNALYISTTHGLCFAITFYLQDEKSLTPSLPVYEEQ